MKQNFVYQISILKHGKTTDHFRPFVYLNYMYIVRTSTIYFVFQGCDSGWHVVNSALLQHQAQVLAHADCLGAVFYFNGHHCF